MDGNQATRDGRTLAGIERDLFKAEEAFADADDRVMQAERDRHAALDEISRCQTELDQAIAELRQRSIPGSKWQLALGKGEDALILQPEDPAKDETALEDSDLTSEEAADCVLEHIEQLKSHAQSEDSDQPVRFAMRAPRKGGFKV